MAGTLTNFTVTTSFNFHNNRLSLNTHIHNHNTPKASLQTVILKSTKPITLYDILNIKTNATVSEIKSAYRSLAKRYHPDASGSNRNDDRDFIDISNAYVTLSDPTSRALYDLKLSGGFQRRRSGGLYDGAGKMAGVYAGRRWETDQCW